MSGTVLNLGVPGVGQHPFINFIKSMSWQPTDPSVLDVNMYPQGAITGFLNNPCTVPISKTTASDHWIIDWEGDISSSSGITLLAIQNPTIHSGSSFVNGSTQFNTNLKGNNGRVEFSFSTPISAFTLSLGSVTFTNFTNLRLYPKEWESRLLAGEIFNPDFIAQLAEEKANCPYGRFILRFLDWGAANSGNFARYEDLTPAGSVSWVSGYWRPDNWAGTVAGTDTYTCSNGPGHNASAYEDGEIIQGKFTNANSSTTPTINRGSLGAKTIVNYQGSALSSGNISANGNKTLCYSALLGKFIMSTENSNIRQNVPLSVMLALCNKIGAGIWLPLPLMFTNSAWASLTAAIRGGLNPGLPAYLEVGNEIWNFAFPMTNLAVAFARAHGFSEPSNGHFHSYYGLRVRQTAAIAAAAWIPRPASELKRVIACQAGAGEISNQSTSRLGGAQLKSIRTGTATITIASPAVITISGIDIAENQKIVLSTTGALATGLSAATDYYAVNAVTSGGNGGKANLAATPGGAAINTSGSQSGTHTATYTNLSYQSLVGVDYNVAPNRPGNFANVLAYAVYTRGANASATDGQYTLGRVNTVKAWADDYATGDPALMASAMDALDNDIRAGSGGTDTLLVFATDVYPGWETVRASYSLEFAGYEGNLEIAAPSTGRLTALGVDTSYSALIANLYAGYKSNDRFKTLTVAQFSQQTLAHGGSPIPSIYHFCPGTTSQWSTHLTDLYSTKFKSHDAIALWNANNNRRGIRLT